MIQRAVSHFRSAPWDIPPESAIPWFSILERDCEVELAHADEEVDATTADSKIAELLAVAPGTPLPRIRQTIHSTKGKAHLCPRLLSLRRHTLLIRRFRASVSPGPP